MINTAKDFSCSITDVDGNIISFSDGLPIHSGNPGLVAKVMRDLFEDIRPGDCFLNNSPYYGNTHHADYTTTVPVFYGEGVPIGVKPTHLTRGFPPFCQVCRFDPYFD